MKSALKILIIVLLISCNNKTDKKNAIESKEEVTSAKEIKTINPCDIFSSEQLVTIFNIQTPGNIEVNPKSKYGSTLQCQFAWYDNKETSKSSQVIIDISAKTSDMGATFSRMLELDLEKGLSGTENGKVVVIMPEKIDNFGDFAYHWQQPSFQNLQKISFQLDNQYRVDITYNSYKGIGLTSDEIKNNLMQIAQLIKQKI